MLDDRAAFGPQTAGLTLVAELVRACGVPDDQPAKAAIADQDIGAKAKNEVGYIRLARREHGIRKRIGGRRFEEQVGGSADLERRVRRERLRFGEACSRVQARWRVVRGSVNRAGHVEDERNYGWVRDATARTRSRSRAWRFAVAAHSCAFVAARRATRRARNATFSATTLPNGLEVIVVENRGVPLVTIEADVKNGSFTQGPEFEGLSHLYEHMFFKANASIPEP